MHSSKQRAKPNSDAHAAPPVATNDVALADHPQIGDVRTVASLDGREGQSLGPEIRRDMEARFGHDFSTVRIFADDAASAAADRLDARAFTIGTDIGFAPGKFAPQTPEGRGLLAHELTHVVQTNLGSSGNRLLSERTDASEQEAEQLGAVTGAVAPTQAPSALIQRDGNTAPAPAPLPTATPPGPPPPPGAGPNPGGAPPSPVPSGQKPPPISYAAFKFDENDIRVLQLRAEILDGIKPSVLAENKFVGDVFGIRVELTGEELEPARDKVRKAMRAKFPDIKRRADRAYADYKAEYNYRANMPFGDRALWDLAHTNFFGGPNAASPNPLDRDPGDKITEEVDNVETHLEKVDELIKTNNFKSAANYLGFAERGSYDAVRPLVRWKEQDLKGAENTIAQLEAIKFASDVALVALGGLGGVSMAKTAGNIAMGQALATQGLLIAAKYAAGDKIDWKKEGITGIVNVVVAKFGGHLSNGLAKKLAGAGAVTLSEEMSNKIIAALIVHEGSTVLTTSVEFVYKNHFEEGAKPATWQEFFDALLARMVDPKGIVMAVLGAAVQSAVDFKPAPGGTPAPVDATTSDSVRARTGTILSKGGPEAVGLARSVIVEEKNFYGVRTLASERGTWGTAAQGPLEQARQEAIDKVIGDLKSKYPNTPIQKSGGGFINPYVITVKSKAAEAAGPAKAVSPMAVSGAPPAGGNAPAPAPAPGGMGSGTPVVNPQASSGDHALKAAWQQEAVAAWNDLGQGLEGLPFRPWEMFAFAKSLDAKAVLDLGPDLEPVAPFGPNEYGGMAPKLDEGRFELVRTMGNTPGKPNEGTSEKMVLRDKETGEEFLFKPQSGDPKDLQTHQAQGIMPGSFMGRARASYGVGLQMPSATGNSPAVNIVQYKGQYGSLQKWIKGTRSLNELHAEDPKLATEVVRSPEFKKFKSALDAYDYVINSVDRNPGNILVKFGPDGKTVEGFLGVDQDLTLTPGMRIIGGGSKAAPAPAKISRATYNELLGMKANEAAIRDGLTLTLNPDLQAERSAKIDGIFERLDTMLKGYDAKQAKDGKDSIFLD